MVTWITNDIISFLTAIVRVGFLIPQILVTAFPKNLFDKVVSRKVHEGVMLARVPLYCNSVNIAIGPLVIPCFDVLRVSLYRPEQSGNLILPNKSHIYCKWLALGLMLYLALSLIIAFAVGLIFINMQLFQHMNTTLIVSLDILTWALINIGFIRSIKDRVKRVGEGK